MNLYNGRMYQAKSYTVSSRPKWRDPLVWVLKAIPRLTIVSLGMTLFVGYSLILSTFAFADNLSSDNYAIKMGTINMTGGHKDAPDGSYHMTDTMGQTAPGRFTSTGYIVRSGFQYIYTTFTPFTFVISKLAINFTNLIPGTAQTDTNTLSVTTGSAFGYAISVFEDHALKLQNAAPTIPDTACDTGTPCTISTAAPWTLSNTYGFGYNMSGTDVTADFINNTYFKPFPNVALGQTPVIIASRTEVATQAAVSTATYKLNISAAQQAGTYENNIQYIATPAF